MTEVVLRTQALSKRFGGLAAVNDVSLELNTGEIHAVIGPNGAGKTTLVNLLSGRPTPTNRPDQPRGRRAEQPRAGDPAVGPPKAAERHDHARRARRDAPRLGETRAARHRPLVPEDHDLP